VARLRALLRRSAEPVRSWGDVRLDPTSHTLASTASSVTLSPTEFRLMAKLLTAPDAITRRRDLVSSAWPAGAIVSDNTLDQYITKLRRKLTEVESAHVIEAARGVGYRIR
jgi:two-component system response regulator MprA